MKHKILIPLDGSEFSRRILPHICSFLNSTDNELILLHVAEPPRGIVGEPARPVTHMPDILPMYQSARDIEFARHPIYTTQLEDSLRATLEDELHADVVRLQEAGYTVSVAVKFGDPAHEIIDFVKDEAIDLIAMATHGRTGLSRLLFGSVAEQVLRIASVPVMLVRPFEQPAAIRAPGEVLAERLAEGQPVRMVVATDGSPFAQTATVFAGNLARALKTEVTLLAAARDEASAIRARDILDEARTLLDPPLASLPSGGGLRGGSVLLIGHADEVIVRHLTRRPADLLIIGAFGDRGATRFFVGSTAQRLVQHAPTSVLMVKGQQPAAPSPRPSPAFSEMGMKRGEGGGGGIGKLLACTAMGDEVVVDIAARLAKAVGADLRVLHVVPPSATMYLTEPEIPDVSLDQVLEQETPLARHLASCLSKMEALGLDGREVVRVRRGAVPDAIFEEAQAGGYDLIIVGSQAGPVRDRYFMGSIADRIVKHAHQSVLVVRTTRQ
jgi:nucleotide-binding universal stress UspA family protein